MFRRYYSEIFSLCCNCLSSFGLRTGVLLWSYPAAGSLYALSDGETALFVGAAQDHKVCCNGQGFRASPPQKKYASHSLSIYIFGVPSKLTKRIGEICKPISIPAKFLKNINIVVKKWWNLLNSTTNRPNVVRFAIKQKSVLFFTKQKGDSRKYVCREFSNGDPNKNKGILLSKEVTYFLDQNALYIHALTLHKLAGSKWPEYILKESKADRGFLKKHDHFESIGFPLWGFSWWSMCLQDTRISIKGMHTFFSTQNLFCDIVFYILSSWIQRAQKFKIYFSVCTHFPHSLSEPHTDDSFPEKSRNSGVPLQLFPVRFEFVCLLQWCEKWCMDTLISQSCFAARCHCGWSALKNEAGADFSVLSVSKELY